MHVYVFQMKISQNLYSTGFFLNKGTGALRPDTPGVRHPTEMPTEPVRLGSVLTCCCTTYTISQNDLFSAKISQHHHLTMCLILK